jgi:hypothetical protein
MPAYLVPRQLASAEHGRDERENKARIGCSSIGITTVQREDIGDGPGGTGEVSQFHRSNRREY